MSKTFDDPDLPASAEELAQAEALARALDGAGAGTSAELEAAALLRQARGGQVPDVLGQVLPALKAHRRRWWLLPTLLVPAAAGLLVLGTGLLSYRAAAPPAGREALYRRPTLRPSSELLGAQARAASGDRAALAALEVEMRRYRPELYRHWGRE